MKKRLTIRKILFVTMWVVVIGCMTTLLIAANRKEKTLVCSQVLIGIKGTGEKFYVEKADIMKLVETVSKGSLVNRNIGQIDLAALERALNTNSWIGNAQLYFDATNALHILVMEREPVARIFTVGGSSFYIDSSGHRMSLVDQLSARVPVITGYPDLRDSAIAAQVKIVANYVYGNEFWNAQIGQIDITPQKNFEMIPVVGTHIIRVGSGDDIESKLSRLYTFYQQVGSKVGFSKYAVLDVRFDRQVVAVRREPTSPVDSIQLQKNIEDLMNKAALQDVDDNMLPGNQDSIATTAAPSINTVAPPSAAHPPSNPPKTPIQSQSRPVVRSNQRPRAVMRAQ